MSKDSGEVLIDAAALVFQADSGVANLVANLLRDIRALGTLADDSSGCPNRRLCASMALAVVNREVSKLADHHFEACMEELRARTARLREVSLPPSAEPGTKCGSPDCPCVMGDDIEEWRGWHWDGRLGWLCPTHSQGVILLRKSET